MLGWIRKHPWELGFWKREHSGLHLLFWRHGKLWLIIFVACSQVLDLPIVDSLRPRPNYLPLAIPEEISSKLTTLHGAPIVWFIGQILKFLMRPSPEIEDYLNSKRTKFNFRTPIVGVHVRRTDKINTEAAFHSLSNYMVEVADFYNQIDLFNQRQNKVYHCLFIWTQSLINLVLIFCFVFYQLESQSGTSSLFGNGWFECLEERNPKLWRAGIQVYWRLRNMYVTLSAIEQCWEGLSFPLDSKHSKCWSPLFFWLIEEYHSWHLATEWDWLLSMYI